MVLCRCVGLIIASWEYTPEITMAIRPLYIAAKPWGTLGMETFHSFSWLVCHSNHGSLSIVFALNSLETLMISSMFKAYRFVLFNEFFKICSLNCGDEILVAQQWVLFYPRLATRRWLLFESTDPKLPLYWFLNRFFNFEATKQRYVFISYTWTLSGSPKSLMC